MLDANGIRLHLGVMRHLVYLETVYTYEGTHEIHALAVGRDIAGEQAFVQSLPPAGCGKGVGNAQECTMTTQGPADVQTVADVQALSGQELGVSPWFAITQEQVDTFADLTSDHQYIHVDAERASQTMYGGTIAHGYFTLSLVTRLSRERDGVRVKLPCRMTINYGLNRVRFPGPVPVGRRIRMRTKLLDVEAINPGAGPDGQPQALQLTYQQTIEVEDQERPGMVAETLTRIYF